MSCLMNFGEVIIPSSRAFWDNCEEDDFDSIQDAEKKQLQFDAGTDETPIASELFILIEGTNVSEFANGALITPNEATKVCGIPSKTSAVYFNASNRVLFAVIDEDLTTSGEVTELLKPYAKLAKRVVAVTLKPKVEFKSEQICKYSNDIVIVRSVGVNDHGVVELEAPNFIAGVIAGIATSREESDLLVNTFVIYTDKIPLDAIAAQPVLNLFRKLGINCNSKYTPQRKDVSHLYM